MKLIVKANLLLLAVFGMLHASRSQEKKDTICQRLVEKGAKYLKKHPIDTAIHVFQNDPYWRKGEIFIICCDQDGTIFSFGDEVTRIWTSFDAERVVSGERIKDKLAALGHKGDWLTFKWNNSLMFAYVKKVIKGETTYYLMAGSYPESSKSRSQRLVKRAIDSVKRLGLQDTFSLVDNPIGSYVEADAHVFIIGEDGTIYASPFATKKNQNVYTNEGVKWSVSPASWKAFFKSRVKSRWFETQNYNTTTRVFAEKFVDPDTSVKYAAASLYFPEIDSDDDAYNLVQKAINYIKTFGKDTALAEFNRKVSEIGQFSVGPMYIFVFDPTGLCLAFGEDPGFVGLNMLDRMNDSGELIYKKIIDQAMADGKTWVSTFNRNAYQTIYAEKVSLASGDIIIGTGYWPASKETSARSMVDRAVDRLTGEPFSRAMEDFTNIGSDFLRGDLYVRVFDPKGIVLADGPYQKDVIWHSMLIADFKGGKVMERIRDAAQEGGGWIEFYEKNAWHRLYATQVEISSEDVPKNVIVASGYYL